MPIIGVIEAELQGSRRQERGGIGPLFRRTEVIAPFSTGEFLSRTLRALERAGDFAVVNLFVDNHDLLAAADDDEDGQLTLAGARDAVDAARLDDGNEFLVMLAAVDDISTYDVTVEGSRTHELGDPTFTVHVGRRLHAWEDPEGEAFDPLDEERDYLAEMESFIEELHDAFDRELALADPDLRVWEEDLPSFAREEHGPPPGVAS